MPDIQRTLSVHQQLYPASCAASAMELALKFHDKIPDTWFDYQHEFKDTNIGFTQLSRLISRGLATTETRLAKTDFFAKMTEETQAGRFPLVSLPNGAFINYHTGERVMGIGWHIWLAIPDGSSFKLVARNHNTPQPIQVANLAEVIERILDFEPQYQIHCAIYTLQ
jgi:hypothetical protein